MFSTRRGPDDLRLGDIALRSPADYDRAEVVVVGRPQDEGVRSNQGRTGARPAPATIRRALYRYALSEAHEHLRLLDAGDIAIRETLEQTHADLTSRLAANIIVRALAAPDSMLTR